MKPFGRLIPLEEARQIIDSRLALIERTEKIAIDDAPGRISAEDIDAASDTPPFNRAAVDGYAVRAEDTFGATPSTPRRLRSIECVYAGTLPKGVLSSGECIQICTGAPMPEGADAVVMVEETACNGQDVSIFKSLSPQSGIGFKGEDIRKGERVIGAGQVLNAGKIGVLASQGLSQALVYAKPRVAVMPTGKEVVEIGRRLAAGQLYDINSHTLSAVIKENGAIPLPMKVTGDSLEEVRSSLNSAIAADMVVISGGSSMGEKDLIINVLEECGEVLFHGIKVKPGKPTAFAVVSGKPVLGMPGYPTSCLLNAYLLLAPALRKMGRLPLRRDMAVTARLGERVHGSVDRERFQTVRLENGVAWPVIKESGAITGTAYADGYLRIPVDGMIEKGADISVSLF